MNKELKKEINELHNVLEKIIVKVVRSYGNSSSDRLRKYSKPDKYDESIEKGIYVGSVTRSEVDYIGRISFKSDETKKDKYFWFMSEDGWVPIGKLLDDREHIFGLINETLRYNNVDKIDETHLDYLKTKFRDVEDCIQRQRESLSTEDVARHVENHNYETLRDIVTSKAKDSIELWKLLFSKQNGQIIENDVEIEYLDKNYIFIRSERKYHDKEYPVGVLILRDKNNSFKVYRVDRNRCGHIDESDYNWTQNDVKDSVGYDYDLFEVDALPPQRTRISENKIISKIQMSKQLKREIYNRTFYRFLNELISIGSILDRFIENNYNNVFEDRYNVMKDFEGVRFTKNYGFSEASRTFISTGKKTEELKEIQDVLNISEEEVRKVQERRSIERLSANLRNNIINDIFFKDLLLWLLNNKQILLEEISNQNSVKAQIDSTFKEKIEISLINDSYVSFYISDKIDEEIIFELDQKERNIYRIKLGELDVRQIRKMTGVAIQNILETETSNCCFTEAGNGGLFVKKGFEIDRKDVLFDIPFDEYEERMRYFKDFLSYLILSEESTVRIKRYDGNDLILPVEESGIYRIRNVEELNTRFIN